MVQIWHCCSDPLRVFQFLLNTVLRRRPLPLHGLATLQCSAGLLSNDCFMGHSKKAQMSILPHWGLSYRGLSTEPLSFYTCGFWNFDFDEGTATGKFHLTSISQRWQSVGPARLEQSTFSVTRTGRAATAQWLKFWFCHLTSEFETRHSSAKPAFVTQSKPRKKAPFTCL